MRHENTLLLVVTLLIGAVVGLVVVAFIVVTERLGAAPVPGERRRLAPPGRSRRPGALISGLLLARYFPNARGSGIPQTKTALFLHDGLHPLRTVLGKFALFVDLARQRHRARPRRARRCRSARASPRCSGAGSASGRTASGP